VLFDKVRNNVQQKSAIRSHSARIAAMFVQEFSDLSGFVLLPCLRFLRDDLENKGYRFDIVSGFNSGYEYGSVLWCHLVSYRVKKG
jgi:hypothetical protein